MLCRVVITDHGAFVLINVYVPNAGDRPARARLAFKLAFLRALKAKADALVAAGREVRAGGGGGGVEGAWRAGMGRGCGCKCD